MFINIKTLRPHQFAWNWRKDQRVLLIGLYFWAVGFDFGLKRSAWYKHFSKKCDYCYQQLTIISRQQVVSFHKNCRTAGRRELIKKYRAERKNYGKPQLSFFGRLFSRLNFS